MGVLGPTDPRTLPRTRCAGRSSRSGRNSASRRSPTSATTACTPRPRLSRGSPSATIGWARGRRRLVRQGYAGFRLGGVLDQGVVRGPPGEALGRQKGLHLRPARGLGLPGLPRQGRGVGEVERVIGDASGVLALVAAILQVWSDGVGTPLGRVRGP